MRFIFLNGKKIDYPEDLSISELLIMRDLDETIIAVERNLEVIPKSLYSSLRIMPGDKN